MSTVVSSIDIDVTLTPLPITSPTSYASCPIAVIIIATTDEIPAEVVENEKNIEMGRDDLSGKPDQIKEKIVAGRIT